MKLRYILLAGAAATVGGVYLYRRGQRQIDTGISPGTVGNTVLAGIKDVLVSVRASSPTAGATGTTTGTTRTAAGDAVLGQTAVRHNRFRLTRLQTAPVRLSAEDAFAQGIN